MNARLQEGDLTLPAPIIFDFGDAMFGFAGNRRTNLAFENGQELEAFVVDARDFARPDDQKQIFKKS